MNTLKEYSGVVALVIAIILAGQMQFVSNKIDSLSVKDDGSSLGSGTRFPNGLSTNSTSPTPGQLLTTTLQSTSLATLDGGQLRSNTNSTSTLASMTMQVSDVAGYDTVLINPTGAAAAKTLTFFASSTATTWLPTAGDMQETCFLNATGTAATTLVFAAGAGIDLETASSSPTDLTILAGNTACFKFIRKPATAAAFDIVASMIEYTDGD